MRAADGVIGSRPRCRRGEAAAISDIAAAARVEKCVDSLPRVGGCRRWFCSGDQILEAVWKRRYNRNVAFGLGGCGKWNELFLS